MYTPIVNRSTAELIGLIATDKAVFSNASNNYLCYDGTFKATPRLDEVVVKTVSLEQDEIDLLVAEYAAKSPAVTLTTVPIFVWTDNWVKKSSYSNSASTYAAYLVSSGKVIIG